MAKPRTTLSYLVRRSLLLLIAFMLFTTTVSVPASQTAYAEGGGAIGGGGNPEGGTGGGQSYYGWGWYNYSVNGNPAPAGFKNPPGGSWTNMSQQCKSIGADRVIAFIFLTEYGSDAANGIVYQYKSGNHPAGYDDFSQHRSGGDWLDTATAQRYFNSPFLDPYREAYTWGQNVAWFCYSADPPPQWTFDLADCTRAAGWVFDRSRPGDSVRADLQVDGVTKIWGSTNVLRTDVNNAYSIVGNHGFDYDISNWVSGSGSHTVSVYTYNINSTGVQTNPTSPLLIGTKTVSGCRDYTLAPSINITSSKVAEADSVITMQPRIDNTGLTDSGSTTQWKLTSFQVAPGSAVPQLDKTPATIYNSDQANPCSFYAGSGVSGCGPAVFTGPNNTASNSGLNVPVPYHLFDPRTAVAGDFAPGTKICYALSAQPRSTDSAQWVYSNPACATIGKSPKVQIWGGDLISAGAVDTSTTNKSINGKNYTFGSWIEYGIFAISNITGAASGSAYAGTGLANTNNCNESQLSFTNSTALGLCSLAIGNYTNSPSIPDVAASFPVSASSTNLTNSNLTSQATNTVYKGSSAITISGGTIPPGKWLVLNAPSADVTISGNITYSSGTMHSVADIPQVVIIAKNIYITDKVTQVDAWLIAKVSSSGSDGTINTCSSVGGVSLKNDAPLTTGICNQQLIVNGPVMADKLYLRRTYGSGAGPDHSGDPAEIFNLRPDAYLWASLRATGNNRVQTVYSTELPPRL